MMVRDEPFAVYGLASIVDYVDEAIVVDTGSTDGTWEELQEFSKDNPKIILEQRPTENCHNWSIQGCVRNEEVINTPAAQFLGDLRQEMHSRSKGKFVWLIDGDEVYYASLAKYVKELAESGIEGINVVFLSFIDYINKIGDVRQLHHMGRLFRQDATQVTGKFTAEMHYRKADGIVYHSMGHPDCLIMNAQTVDMYVQHFECIIKPFRKEKRIIQTIPKHLPEIFEQLIDKFPRVKKYIED
jgi:glycosyltransferase involved in cell wall biosynthesis